MRVGRHQSAHSDTGNELAQQRRLPQPVGYFTASACAKEHNEKYDENFHRRHCSCYRAPTSGSGSRPTAGRLTVNRLPVDSSLTKSASLI